MRLAVIGQWPLAVLQVSNTVSGIAAVRDSDGDSEQNWVPVSLVRLTTQYTYIDADG
jgi:hypothetical protein